MHSDNKLQIYFFLAVLALVGILNFFVFQPFLMILVLAMVLAVLLGPLYMRLVKKLNGRRGLSAVIIVLLACVIVILPLVLIGVQLVNETTTLYNTVRVEGFAYLDVVMEKIAQPLSSIGHLPKPDFGAYLEQFFSWGIRNLGALFSGTAQLLVSVFLVIIALFFFLRDGDKVGDVLMLLSPLDDSSDARIIKQIKDTVFSVVGGALIIAIVQGTLVGVGLLLFGVPNATLWGTIAAFSALVPGVGAGLVVIPSVAFLYFTTGLWPALGLLVWGLVLVGLVDNMLLPYLYGRGVRIHPLLILLSVLGGLAYFGPLGFIFGPLVLSLLLALLDIYKEIITHAPAQKKT